MKVTIKTVYRDSNECIVVEDALYDSDKTPIMLQMPDKEREKILEATKDGDHMCYKPSNADVVIKVEDRRYTCCDAAIEILLSPEEGEAIGYFDCDYGTVDHGGKIALFPTETDLTEEEMREWMRT